MVLVRYLLLLVVECSWTKGSGMMVSWGVVIFRPLYGLLVIWLAARVRYDYGFSVTLLAYLLLLLSWCLLPERNSPNYISL